MDRSDLARISDSRKQSEEQTLHPAWRRFIQYCAQLKHGEIERLCIQDGLPVLAESTTKKVKFTS